MAREINVRTESTCERALLAHTLQDKIKFHKIHGLHYFHWLKVHVRLVIHSSTLP
jgi:hypothetical protein